MGESILLIGTFFSHINGFRSGSEDLATYCREKGWHVITTSHHPNRFRRILDILTTIWKYKNEYKVARIDVYSGPAFFWAEAAAWLLKKLNKPFILTLHGGNLPLFATHWPNRVSRLMQSANIVTTPSHYLLETIPSINNGTHLIPNHIDVGSHTFKMREVPQPYIIWLRAFHSIYNPTIAPRVLAQLMFDFPNARLIMVGLDKGDGSLQQTIKVAETLGVAEKIDLPGGIPKNDVPNWLAKGDIFINTTNIDNTPISVLEALACGLCVVSTNVGGIPYLLEDEHDALLVPPDDPLAMAEAVRRILTESGLAQRLSSNARRKAEQFDWKVIMPQWESTFKNIMEKG
ncbi:MAG: glycosyltransferase family 4 protein [Anaerolineales bacterium]|jgi:glycosyltransferase involved in cell wall biosynthesis